MGEGGALFVQKVVRPADLVVEDVILTAPLDEFLEAGRASYSNAGGGTSHAVDVVGMFHIDENADRIAKDFVPPT